MATSLLDKPESDWLAEIRELRHRGDDGDDPRGSGALGVEMDVLPAKRRFTAPAGSRPPSKAAAQAGLIYRGTLEPPKGKLPEDWGGARTDAVPLDRAWRRRGPADPEIGWQLDLFRARHRLSLGQDRPRLRRS